MTIKHLQATLKKTPGADADGTFVLSTEDVDRDGDVILVDGWELNQFLKNPVALWQHDHRSPVGRWENIRIEGKRLIGDLRLASTNLAEMTRKLIDDGVLRAVSVGFRPKAVEPRDPEKPGAGFLIKAAELLEASLVSVPANPAALLMAKAYGLSAQEMQPIFDHSPTHPVGKSADQALIARARSLTGKSAGDLLPPTPSEGNHAMTLSDRIKGKQTELNALRDELALATEKYAEDASDEQRELVEGFADRIDDAESQLKTLKKAEAAIMSAVNAPAAAPAQAPGVIQSRKNYDAGELIFRQAAVKFLSHCGRKSISEVVRERYPTDKGLEAVIKAAAAPGDTTTTAWAAALLDEQVTSFVDLLANNSVYGALRGPGLALNFNGAGSIKIPARTTTKTAPGAFVGEAAPIPVKELSFTSQTLTRHKMGVISTMSEELIDATNMQIEAIVRQAILDDTAKTLDTILMDATAGSTTRPAGLLNGVTPTASAGTTAANIITDLKALLAVFQTDDAGKNLRIVINPVRLLGLATAINAVGDMQFADEVARGTLMGIPLVVSANVATDEVHCINAGEFATAYDGPAFSVSNTATLHMEDTSPAEIVSATPTTASPVRSLFQTDVVAIRMILPVTWTMRRASQVASLSGVAW